MNETLKKYLEKFDEYPALPYAMHCDSKIAIQKMEKAIKRGTPLTPKDFNNVRCEGVYDKEEK